MKTFTSNQPAWALLAPLDPIALRARGESIQQELYRPADSYEPPWEVVTGSDGTSALVSYQLGSEGTDEGIAEVLSAETPGQVLLLRFAEDNEVAWGYEGGQLAVECEDPPDVVAAQFGIKLPGLPAQEPPRLDPCVCFVPGRPPDEVAGILGFDVPPNGPLHVEAVRDGTVVYSDAGSAAIFLRELSRGGGGRVYLLVSHDGGRRFSCWVVEGGEDVGRYAYPPPATSTAGGFVDSPVLDHVAGETEPARILEALGVPPSLLGLR